MTPSKLRVIENFLWDPFVVVKALGSVAMDARFKSGILLTSQFYKCYLTVSCDFWVLVKDNQMRNTEKNFIELSKL